MGKKGKGAKAPEQLGGGLAALAERVGKAPPAPAAPDGAGLTTDPVAAFGSGVPPKGKAGAGPLALPTDPPSGSPADLGYGKAPKGKPLPPDRLAALERVTLLVAEKSKVVDALRADKKSRNADLKAAEKGLTKLLREQNAIRAGEWHLGMFDKDDDGKNQEG
jgi:hypothetical protein